MITCRKEAGIAVQNLEGRKVSRPLPPFFRHYGRCIDANCQFIVDNLPGVNTRIVPLQGFSNGFPVRVEPSVSPYDAASRVQRARALVGNCPYHLTAQNCEHLAPWVETGISRSQQVESAVFLGLVMVACYLAAN